MANKKQIISFLKALKANNSKEWMDNNRSEYHTAKDNWLDEIQQILRRLSVHNQAYFSLLKPKDTISRINNNRRFNQNLPVYKNYFTFSVMDKSDLFSPLHLSIGAESSFVGVGYHSPEKEQLQSIREAIDYDGQELQDILEEKSFVDFYGGISDYSKKLKTSPHGYSNDHKYVDLLRYKSFVVSRNLSEGEFLSDQFIDIIERAYLVSQPFRAFLKKATSV